MLRWISRLILISALCGPSFVRAGDVDFPDANLDTVIREILKKKQIDKSDKTKKITEEDLATMRQCSVARSGQESNRRYLPSRKALKAAVPPTRRQPDS